MSALHAHFHLRNQQAFQRLLDGSEGSRGQSSAPSSGGKSWNRPSPLSGNAPLASPLDVNARDWLGRTVLHLATAAQDAAATEYVRLLLAHPNIQINVQDVESHWTALHRALYHGNLASAVLLLQRPDIDPTLRDPEGYTAFDLYNSTLEGTKPTSDDASSADLHTWGANRNAALGLGNGDDRLFPEQVALRPHEGSAPSQKDCIDTRFAPVRIRQVAMSKLHTAVVTSEPRTNLRVCGFGSGGRLGLGQHTQYSLVPLPQFNGTVASAALGQDHTLAVTRSGEVYSWGLNRFSQLGYVVELSDGAKSRGEEPIQPTARKVVGPLKNKVVKGVAACKTASACWTAEEVYTWGTNTGQLGYDKSAHPVQVLPRIVTKVSQPVLAITITDSAMACLLETKDVICLWNDGHFKVNFPAHAFPSEITVYRPPHSISNSSIEKITSCECTFAALSSNGELFTFTVPSASELGAGGSTAGSKPRTAIVPQRVWALRKKFTAVKDVALGSDGAIVICTESGHVFVRTRTAKPGHGAGGNGKTHKFAQMPHLQRIVRVCANVTGAYGALRTDYVPPPVRIVSKVVAQDLAEVQPWLYLIKSASEDKVKTVSSPSEPTALAPGKLGEDRKDEMSDDEGEDLSIQKDIKHIRALLILLQDMKEAQPAGADNLVDEKGKRLPHGADILIQIHPYEVPAHRVMLAARSSVLCRVLSGGASVQDASWRLSIKLLPPRSPDAQLRLAISACQPLSVLLLLTYLYSDDVPALWDPRVGMALSGQLPTLGVRLAQVKQELQALARVLELPLLATALEAPVKRVPRPSMVDDLTRLFNASQAQTVRRVHDPLAPDVVLSLADREVHTHSLVLRARSPFFAAFFDEEEWTRKRWTAEGTVVVDMGHLKGKEMEYVCRYLCCGGDQEMFEVLEHIDTVDQLLDFMFNVMAAANELHIDRLMLICSQVILKRVNITNICSILSDASFYHALPLVESLHAYMAANMETLLESRMLDDVPPHLVKQLSIFVRDQQVHKYPNSRSPWLVERAMQVHSTWLSLEDFPQPVVPSYKIKMGAFRDSPKMSPPGPSKRNRRTSQFAMSPPSSPVVRPVIAPTPASNLLADDEVFMMDDPDAPGLSTLTQPVTPTPESIAGSYKSMSGWRAISSAPKVDMRTIIAEAESSTPPKRAPVPGAIARKASSEGPAPLRGTPPKGLTLPITARPPSGTPWRQPQAPATSTSPAVGLPVVPSPSRAELSTLTPRTVPSALGTQPTTPTKKPAAGTPGMGPTFTPSKKAASQDSPPSIRRVSGSVWTLPPVQPIVQSSTTTGMSFVAIQELQREQNRGPAKDKRSLLQIQEEERARQVEEDFLKWWAAEETRLKAAEQGVPQASQRPQKSKKPKPSKLKPNKTESAPGPTTTLAPSPAPKEGQKNQASSKKLQKKHPAKGSAAPKSTAQ